jgi:hypothetical protein
VYNEGLYGCLKNPEVDQQARDMFADGFGSTSAEILRQVEFIGRNYGGAAGFKAAYSLAPDITRDIPLPLGEIQRVRHISNRDWTSRSGIRQRKR